MKPSVKDLIPHNNVAGIKPKYGINNPSKPRLEKQKTARFQPAETSLIIRGLEANDATRFLFSLLGRGGAFEKHACNNEGQLKMFLLGETTSCEPLTLPPLRRHFDFYLFVSEDVHSLKHPQDSHPGGRRSAPRVTPGE